MHQPATQHLVTISRTNNGLSLLGRSIISKVAYLAPLPVLPALPGFSFTTSP